MVIWIVGLPGCGKTTLAKELHQYFLNHKTPSVHIDGDDMRSIWGSDIGYSIDDREKNSRRIQKIGKIFENQGLNVVVSISSIFEKHRVENKTLYKKYFEIFLDIPLHILKKRRIIYQNALDGEINHVLGVDIAYSKPTTYNVKINENMAIEKLTNIILKELNLSEL